jgi:nicotinamidase-related amidase
MASNLGFNVTVLEDAVATFDRIGFNGTKYSADLVHDVAIASLQDEFASIFSTSNWIQSMTEVYQLPPS